MNRLTDFTKGIIAGVIFSAVLFGVITALFFIYRRDREIIQYAEKQMEIEALREGYINRDTFELLDEIPDIRRAANDAISDFERKRNEALQRFRNRLAD